MNMKSRKCNQCGREIADYKCEKCGHINLTDEQEKRYQEISADYKPINTKLTRYRVPEVETQNVLLNPAFYRRSIQTLNESLKLDSKWEHASGEIWRVTMLNEEQVRIGVIDTLGVLKEGTERTLSRRVFCGLVKNNYFGRTLINRRLIGQDIADSHIRDNFIRL